MAKSFNSAHKRAWDKVFKPRLEHPEEIFPDFKKKKFEDIKREYTEKYGYTIRIPEIDDILHLKPDFLKSDAEIKLEKKQALVRILDSPASDWFRTYSTIMTWIDDIQDTSSVIYPLIMGLAKLAPKAMSKLLPIVGWLGTAFDLLNLLSAFGTLSLTPMAGKRSSCNYLKGNPFSKAARGQRIKNILNWKPSLASAIEQAQVLDNFTGIGLSLGPVIGTVWDAAFGAYRYLNGEKVRFTFDPPDPTNLDLLGARGIRAASNISSHGKFFAEELHFWTYITASLSLMATGFNFMYGNLSELVEDPMNVVLPAATPTNPITIEVIQEAGLNVDQGVGWPYTGEKEISQGELIDIQAPRCEDYFQAYCKRHSTNWYGYYAAQSMDYYTTHVFYALDPESEMILDDTDLLKVFWTMIKAPILPVGPIALSQSADFEQWISDYKNYYGHTPGLIAIEQKLIQLGIDYTAEFPTKNLPNYTDFWPADYTGQEIIT